MFVFFLPLSVLSAEDHKHQVSLAQESPYLLMNRVSCKSLMAAIQKQQNGSLVTKTVIGDNDEEQAEAEEDVENLLGRFRGNLVVDNVPSFREDEWRTVQIGSQVFMVCI